MPHMIRVAKKNNAETIAKKLVFGKTKSADQLYKGYVKDLQKLNYTTLVALVGKVK